MTAPAAKIVGRLALKVIPDTSDFTPKLKAFAERMERSVKIELPVTVDRRRAAAELALIKKSLQAQASINAIDIPVRADGRHAFATIFAGLKTMRQHVAGSTSAMQRWIPILLVVGGLIIGLGPALATVIPFLGGLAAGIAVIALSMDKLKSTFKPLTDEAKALKEAVGSKLVAGLAPLVTQIGSKLFPVLQSGLAKFAGVLNSAFKSLARWLTSPAGLARVGLAFDAIASALKPFGQLLTPLTRLFVELSVAAAPGLKLIGDALVDVTNKFADWLASGKGTDAITKAVKDIGKVLIEVGKGVKAVFPVMRDSLAAAAPLLQGVGAFWAVILRWVKPLFSFMAQHKTTMQVLGVLVGALAFAFALLASPIVLVIATIGLLVAIVKSLPGLWNTVATVAVATWNVIKTAASATWEAIKLGLTAFAIVFAFIFDTIKAATVAAWETIKGAMSAAWNWVKSGISKLWTEIKQETSTAWNAIKTAISTAWNAIKTAVSTGITAVVTFFKELPGKILSALGNLGKILFAAGVSIIQGLLDGIQSMIGKVTAKLKELTALIPKVKGPPTKDKTLLYDAGVLVISGFLDGLESQYSAVRRSLTGFSGSLSTNTALGGTLDFGATSRANIGVLDGALSRRAATASKAGGHTFIVNPSGDVDERQIARYTADAVAWAERGL